VHYDASSPITEDIIFQTHDFEKSRKITIAIVE